MKRLHLVRAVALAAAAAGLAAIVIAMIETPRWMRPLRRKADDIEALQALQPAVHERNAARATFEQGSAQQPTPLIDLMPEGWPSARIQMRSLGGHPAAEGWTVQRWELIADDARMDELSAFLVQVESLRPPWRIVHFELTAGPEAGTGRAVLTLECLERTDAAGS